MKTFEELANEYGDAHKLDEALWLVVGGFFQGMGLLSYVTAILVKISIRILQATLSEDELAKCIADAFKQEYGDDLKKRGMNN